MIDRERIKKGRMKARRLMRIWWAQEDWYRPGEAQVVFEEAMEHHERQLFSTRTPCSCDMCGNPRKLGEKTIQERKADEAWKLGWE